MGYLRHNLRRAFLLVASLLWLGTTLHGSVCHADEAEGEACETSVACRCDCHTPANPACRVEFHAPQPAPVAAVPYLSSRGTRVPSDIFRPPLANR